MEQKSLEQVLKELAEKTSQIHDERIRQEVLDEIGRLRTSYQKINPKTAPKLPRDVQILESAPPDLTAKFVYISTNRFESDVYSTNIRIPLLKKRVFGDYIYGDILFGGGSGGFWDPYPPYMYGGKAAEYIKNSLLNRAKETAGKLNAGLVILGFDTREPFSFRIYPTSGLGRTNFQGQVSAKFYAEK